MPLYTIPCSGIFFQDRSSMLQARVIVNPHTNPQAVRYHLRPALRILRRAGFAVSTAFTKEAGQTRSLAEKAVHEGADCIIAAGGDGTVNEVINAVFGHNLILGILPIGTTNVLARELNYPLNIFSAAKLISRRNTRRIDLGCADGRYFSMMVSCGYDAHAVSMINLKIKRLVRRWAYVWAGIKDFSGYRPTRITVLLDDGSACEEGSFVVISNSHFYGGTYQLTPFAEIDDGLLDVLIFQGRTQIGLVHFIFRMI